MLEELDGRVAVVTGAASGIGLAMSEAFLAEGMHVVLSDRDEACLDAQVARLAEAGGSVSGVVCDVVDPEAVAALADSAWDRYGAVHLLCNNAGVGPAGPMLQTTPAEWRWTFDVNVLGVAHGVTTFAKKRDTFNQSQMIQALAEKRQTIILLQTMGLLAVSTMALFNQPMVLPDILPLLNN